MINMTQKNKLHFTVTEAYGEPFLATFRKSRWISDSQFNRLKDTSHAYIVHPAIELNEPMIHLLPTKMVSESPERILGHETLHITLTKIGEKDASIQYDDLHEKRKNKDIWECD